MGVYTHAYTPYILIHTQGRGREGKEREGKKGESDSGGKEILDEKKKSKVMTMTYM